MLDLKPENLDKELRTLFKKLEDHLALQNMRKKLRPLDSKSDEIVRRYHILEVLVVRACREALTYAESHPDGLDTKEQRRQRDREVLKEIPSQIKAINTLQNFLKQFPEYASYALVQCHQLDNIHLSIDKEVPLNKVWHDFFEAYSKALQEKQIPAKKGPYVHRTQIGALDFGKPIDLSQGGKADSIINGLLFYLTLLFRRFTSNVEPEFLGYYSSGGEPMPKTGRPHYGISADLIQATLDVTVSGPDDLGKRLRKLLQDYPNLTFVGWPQPKPKTTTK